jgi:DNA-binding LacI/PurR family transcriptional regulator
VKSNTGRRPPVMADVAKVAGVSHQTVSRVLNGHPNVRAETRTRVLQAIDQLGYRRNLAARALVTRHSRTLGVVSFNTTLYGPASTVYGIEEAARNAGYFVSIVSLRTIDRAGVHDAIDYLAEQGVDGIVVVAPQRAAAQALADLRTGVPAVAVGGGRAEEVSVVSVDQVEGARLATRHLLDLGHKTVWHISGPSGWLEAEGRIEGWRSALAAAGCAAPEVLTGDWSPRSGYRAGRDRGLRGQRPDGARRAARAQRGRGEGPGTDQPCGFRRHPRVGIFLPSSHHHQAGLRGRGQAQH